MSIQDEGEKLFAMVCVQYKMCVAGLHSNMVFVRHGIGPVAPGYQHFLQLSNLLVCRNIQGDVHTNILQVRY